MKPEEPRHLQKPDVILTPLKGSMPATWFHLEFLSHKLRPEFVIKGRPDWLQVKLWVSPTYCWKKKHQALITVGQGLNSLQQSDRDPNLLRTSQGISSLSLRNMQTGCANSHRPSNVFKRIKSWSTPGWPLHELWASRPPHYPPLFSLKKASRCDWDDCWNTPSTPGLGLMHTVHSVSTALLPLLETPDGFLELLQDQLKVFLHGF